MRTEQTDPSVLISPYGGTLVDLLPKEHEISELEREAKEFASIQVSERSICDLEMLATGAFSPLDRFMNEADYHSVIRNSRLASGCLFPIPITLPIPDPKGFEPGAKVALRTPGNNVIAILAIEEVFELRPREEAAEVLGASDPNHPLLAEMSTWGRHALSGPLKVLRLPEHFDFPQLRRTPAQVRGELERLGFGNVMVIHAFNPMHRAHEEIANRAMAQLKGALLLNPVVGMAPAGDVDHYTRIRVYKLLAARYFDPNRSLLSLLPLAPRMAGPKEALWEALIRRNYGVNWCIFGADFPTTDRDSAGNLSVLHSATYDLLQQHETETGVRTLTVDQPVFVPDLNGYEQVSHKLSDQKFVSLSGTASLESCLADGKPLPGWFTRADISAVLSEVSPPCYRQGLCVWFTGLPSAGKSTIAQHLIAALMEHGRQVTFLDGDVIRTHLSKGLGFSREDRETNILRIGFVAAEVVRHHGVAVCAAVSPYRGIRNQVRGMMRHGGFIEVFVDTPVDLCEQRDPKGFYAKARRGFIKNFTGVDDTYEPPVSPEIRITTAHGSAQECAQVILSHLIETKFIREM